MGSEYVASLVVAQEHCPNSKATDEVIDTAYGGGDLVLSELAALGVSHELRPLGP